MPVSSHWRIFAAVFLLSAWCVQARRTEQALKAKVLERQGFPTAGLKAATTLLGHATGPSRGHSGWLRSPAGGSVAGFAGFSPLRDPRENLVLMGMSEDSADIAVKDELETRALEEEAIRHFPWGNHELEPIMKRKHSIFFSVAGEDKQHTLAYFHPATDRQVENVKERLAKHRAVDPEGAPISADEIAPGAHVYGFLPDSDVRMYGLPPPLCDEWEGEIEKDALEYLRDKCDLKNAEMIKKHKYNMFFSGMDGRHRDEHVTLAYFRPLTTNQAHDVLGILSYAVDVRNSLAAMCIDGKYKSMRDPAIRGFDSHIRAGSHVSIYMKESLGSLEHVLPMQEWNESREKTKHRLLFELVSACMKPRRTRGTMQLRPSDVIITGDLKDEASWHVVLLRNLADDDEKHFHEGEIIRQLGEIGAEMSLPSGTAADLVEKMRSDPDGMCLGAIFEELEKEFIEDSESVP